MSTLTTDKKKYIYLFKQQHIPIAHQIIAAKHWKKRVQIFKHIHLFEKVKKTFSTLVLSVSWFCSVNRMVN